MSIEKIWSYWLTKHHVQKVFRYAETSIKAIHEKHIRNRMVRIKGLVAHVAENHKAVKELK